MHERCHRLLFREILIRDPNVAGTMWRSGRSKTTFEGGWWSGLLKVRNHTGIGVEQPRSSSYGPPGYGRLYLQKAIDHESEATLSAKEATCFQVDGESKRGLLKSLQGQDRLLHRLFF